MRSVREMKYTKDEVAKRIKYIKDRYYIDVTKEGKRLFGETIIESALVRLDIPWVLRRYIPRGHSGEDLEEWYRGNKVHSEIIKQHGAGTVFEVLVNEVLREKHKIQIHASDGIECLVIRFTNGKEMFISNSEWGEVSMVF